MTKGYYTENFRILEKRDPEMAAKIAASGTDGYETILLESGGEPNLHFTGSRPGILLYDNPDPLKNVRDYLNAFPLGLSRLPVLLGFGLGYAAEELLRNRPGIIKMIVIEKDFACLKSAMQARNLTKLLEDDRLVLIAGCEEHDLYVTLYDAMGPYFPGLKEIQFLPWPASVSIAETYYDSVIKAFRTIADTYCADRGNDPYDTLVAYEQFFANIGHLMKHPGGETVVDFFKNRPAVVVATGPSLKKNIHLLKEIEDSAVIISADSSLRILHQHNIYPHMVTTVERPPGLGAHYEGLQNLDKTVFAAASFLHPSTIQAYTGPIMFFHRIYGFMIHLGFEKDVTYMGMSTAHMAYEVARHMGCNPIILVGNDLAYDAAGNTHAPGFILGERETSSDARGKVDVPGNVQPLVKTSQDWLAGIKQYEQRINGWPGKLINATEGGARIRGSEISTLREVIDRYCTQPFYPREALRSRRALWKNPRHPKDLLKTVKRFIAAADEFLAVCLKTRTSLDQILREIESQETFSPELSQRITRTVSHVTSILDSIPQTDLMTYFGEYLYTDIFPLLMEWQVIDYRFADPTWAAAYRIKLAETFFGGMGQLCVSLKEVLLDGQRRLMQIKAA